MKKCRSIAALILALGLLAVWAGVSAAADEVPAPAREAFER